MTIASKLTVSLVAASALLTAPGLALAACLQANGLCPTYNGGPLLIGCDADGAGGNSVRHFHEDDKLWFKIPNVAGVAIAVAPDAEIAYVVDATGSVWVGNENGFVKTGVEGSPIVNSVSVNTVGLNRPHEPNEFTPIGVGPKGEAWVLEGGPPNSRGDSSLVHLQWSRANPHRPGLYWEPVPNAAGVSVAISPQGKPWLLTNDNQILE